jgi:PleD family two-component response regulator
MASDNSPTRSLRVVIAERRGWTARTLASVLESPDWAVSHVQSGAAVLALPPRDRPDIIVLHDDLEDIDAIELTGRLRRDPSVGRLTPIIVVSTDPTRVRRSAAFRGGAWEYAVLPLDAELFLLRLETFARAHRDLDRLLDAALVDPETGLYNEAGVTRRATEIASDATRRKDAVSCVAFAPATERSGGAAAAELLAELGPLIRRSGRVSDVIGRLNGTIIIIAPATPIGGAERLVERLREAIQRDATDSGRARPVEMKASYLTADNFARSSLSLLEMVDRALESVRALKGDATHPAPVSGEAVPLKDLG